MIYDTLTNNESYYELTKGEESLLIPASATIVVDDESGLLAIKAVGTRKTIALVKNASEENEGNGSGGGAGESA